MSDIVTGTWWTEVDDTNPDVRLLLTVVKQRDEEIERLRNVLRVIEGSLSLSKGSLNE